MFYKDYLWSWSEGLVDEIYWHSFQKWLLGIDFDRLIQQSNNISQTQRHRQEHKTIQFWFVEFSDFVLFDK